MRIQIFCFCLLILTAGMIYAAAVPIEAPEDFSSLAGRPDNVLAAIAARLSDPDLARFSEVNRCFHRIAQAEFETRPSYMWAKGDIIEHQFHAHEGGWIIAVFFTTDGNIVSVGRDRRIYVWKWDHDNKTYDKIRQMTDDVNSDIYYARFSRGANRLMLVHLGIINFWDVQTGKRISQLAIGNMVRNTLSPDGTTLAARRIATNDIEFWDVVKGIKIKQIPSAMIGDDYEGSGIVFSADGKKIALSSQGNCPVCIWNIETLAREEQFEFNKASVDLLFLPDNKLIAFKLEVFSEGRIIHSLWDVEANKLIANLILNAPGVKFSRKLIFTDDGKLAALVLSNNILPIWDIRLKKVIRALKVENFIQSLSFSLDSKMLAAGCDNGDIVVWQAKLPAKKEPTSKK